MKQEHITYTAQVISSVCENIQIKCSITIGYMVFSFFFDETRTVALLAILMLIIFDFITGLAVAKVNGQEIKSSKVFRSAIKVLMYFMMIASGHIVESIININFFIDETLMVFLGVTEFISIIENIGNLGFAIPKKLLNKLEEFRDSK